MHQPQPFREIGDRLQHKTLEQFRSAYSSASSCRLYMLPSARREPGFGRVAFPSWMKHHNFGVIEVTDADLTSVELAGISMGTHGRLLRQEDIRSMGKATVPERLMQRGPPVLQLRLN